MIHIIYRSFPNKRRESCHEKSAQLVDIFVQKNGKSSRNPDVNETKEVPPLMSIGCSLMDWTQQKFGLVFSMGISGSKNGGTVPYKAIFWGYIPLHRPYIGLIYGRYLQFRFLKWPWFFCCSKLGYHGYDIHRASHGKIQPCY